MEDKRESLASRLGFLLLSAGCAIGLGNVWRFPYITGMYGGATFILIYLVFLFFLGLPIVLAEFAIGRASKQNIGVAFKTLEKQGSKWHYYGPVAISGNYILMSFYTVITGWIIYYFVSSSSATLSVNYNSEQIGQFFSQLISNPSKQIFWMIIAVILGFSSVAIGLRAGVEKISKVMMTLLIILMLILALNSIFFTDSAKGLAFYLKPSMQPIREHGLGVVLFEAMSQAFFTLSIGIGAMTIFGSYIDKKHTLTGESLRVIGLDTFVALMSGFIIFPAVFAYNIEPTAGPQLIFITLPNVFSNMALGQLWQSLFFLFLSFAALTTLIAVFENIISYWIDRYKISRQKAVVINLFILIAISLPCIFGFNLLSKFNPLGSGTNILDLEDFIVSNTLLPLGSLIFLFFVTRKRGWGFNSFITEVDQGQGPKFFKWMYFYVKYILPIIIIVIFVQGYYTKLAPLLF